MPKPTDADVEAAKAAGKVQRVYQLTLDGRDHGLPDFDVLVRMPSPIEFRRWHQQVQDESRRVNASENLFRAVLLWPEQRAFDEQLAERPAALNTFAGEVLELAGMAKGTEKKSPVGRLWDSAMRDYEVAADCLRAFVRGDGEDIHQHVGAMLVAEHLHLVRSFLKK